MTEITNIPVRKTPARNAAHAAPFTAVLLHDWTEVTMIHFAVKPAVLQPLVPYRLDTFDGRAFVSIVSFRLERVRCPVAPRLTRALLRPLSDHRFLNVRTYVVHDGEPGIYFMAEWLDNPLHVALGPGTFGLPYRLGRLREGRAVAREGALRYRVNLDGQNSYLPCTSGGLDAFLMERYTAFTQHRNTRRRFRIRHAPWPQRRVRAAIDDATLLKATGPWHEHAEYACAHHSPGVFGVEINRPYRIHE